MALSRDIHTDTLAALQGPFFYPIIMVYLDWPDAAVRVHSNVGSVSFEGQSWHGVGNFGDIQLPEEASGLAQQPAQLRLVGLPDDLDDYLDDPIRNREGRILFGAVTERAGNILIGEPFEAFTGYMDALRDIVEVQDASGQKQLVRGVVLNVVSGPSQRSAAEVYHTAEDQARNFPGDTAGRLVINAEAEAGKLTWPE